MKILGVVNGKPIVSGEVERFTCTFACLTKGELDKVMMEWVAKHVSAGWTPITDVVIRVILVGDIPDPTKQLFEVMYLGMFVGVEEAKKIPVRFMRHD